MRCLKPDAWATVMEQGHKHLLAGAGEPISIEEMLKLPCDIFIPAAVPDVIDEKVARELNCRYVVEAANGPTTVEGDQVTRPRTHTAQNVRML